MKVRSVSATAALACACLALPAMADEASMMADARSAATSLPPRLVAALNEEIARSGPAGAIPVCRDLAPKMAKEVAASTGWQLKRVSLKPRNAQRATPNGWEQAVLEDFDRRVAAGESAATLEKGEIVEQDGRRVYRYAKALPTQTLCLNCHGPQETLSPEVKARIDEHYPDDRATGYREGQIRGAIIATKPL